MLTIFTFQILFLTTYMNIHKIYWLHWIDLWINYKIMHFYLLHLNKIWNRKGMSSLEIFNSFIIYKIKQSVAHVFSTKSCVAWWQKHWEELSWLEESERRNEKCDGRVESIGSNNNEKWKEWELVDLSTWKQKLTLWEKGCFVTGLATQFLNYTRHLQLIIFICHEC